MRVLINKVISGELIQKDVPVASIVQVWADEKAVLVQVEGDPEGVFWFLKDYADGAQSFGRVTHVSVSGFEDMLYHLAVPGFMRIHRQRIIQLSKVSGTSDLGWYGKRELRLVGWPEPVKVSQRWLAAFKRRRKAMRSVDGVAA